MLNFCASEIDTRVCPTDTGSYTCSITFRDLKASVCLTGIFKFESSIFSCDIDHE